MLVLLQTEAKRHCHTLGRMHFYKGVQFNREYFEAFKQCAVYVILGIDISAENSTVIKGLQIESNECSYYTTLVNTFDRTLRNRSKEQSRSS